MVKTKQQRRRDRKLADLAASLPQSLAVVTSVEVPTGTRVKVNFAGQIMMKGTTPPQTWLFGTGNQVAASIFAIGPTSITFTMPGTVAAGQPYAIDPYDPAVRTPTGGYVGGSTGDMV